MTSRVPPLLSCTRYLGHWTQLLPTSRAKRVHLLHGLDQTTPAKQMAARRAHRVVVRPSRTERHFMECDLARRKLRWFIRIWSEMESWIVFVCGAEWEPAVRAFHAFRRDRRDVDLFQSVYECNGIEGRASWQSESGWERRKNAGRRRSHQTGDLRDELCIHTPMDVAVSEGRTLASLMEAPPSGLIVSVGLNTKLKGIRGSDGGKPTAVPFCGF
jgi:hypothetical protein